MSTVLPARLTRWLRTRRAEVAAAALVVAVAGPLVHDYTAQPASRYTFTAAIVDHGTVRLDRYTHVLGVDRAVVDGHTYSDKAPLQPVLAVPFYAVARAVGAEPATRLRVTGNLGLWWVTLWSSTVPAAVLAALMVARARRAAVADASDPDAPRRGTLAGTAVATGTLLLPFAALLFGHVLAALALYVTWILADGARRPGRLAVAGFVGGLGVLTEYTAAVGLVVVAVAVAARHRRRPAHLAAFAAGGVPCALALGVWNAALFGSPLTFSYQLSAFNGVQERARPVTGLFGGPALDNVVDALAAPRGLLVATPVVAVGILGAVVALRARRPLGWRADAALAPLLLVAYLGLVFVWSNPWGGDSPGPRYVTPMLGFLAVPVAWAWRRAPVVAAAAAAVSVFTMLVATVTDPLVARDAAGGLGIWLDRLLHGELAPSVFTVALGGPGRLLQVAVAGAAAIHLARVARSPLPAAPVTAPRS